MLQAFIRKHKTHPYKELLQVTMEQSSTRGPKVFHVATPIGDSPWMNIIFFTKKSYQQYAYNLTEKRWSYGENPFPDGSKKKYNLVIQSITEGD